MEKLKINQNLIQKIGDIDANQLKNVDLVMFNSFMFVKHAIKASKFLKHEKLEKSLEN